MHIQRGTFRWVMVKDYVQGSFRYFLYRYMPYLFTEKSWDKYSRRVLNARKDCMSQGQCVKCGCKMPDLLFTDKGCSIQCHEPEELEL